ncbi:ethanolamine ammonia-lyase reactivating factor EutA [Bacillus sp. REN3]|uniref:ethanolamine ammonia-lyase reactivating factor EutA n=1 Tax=Bacillus sp. REN3 TaxID=2802440 RepID=UPI001AED37DF|nr:ethanolamine ammonia-lyase reactivating factor EutA [Bacillus sp. REN3]
MKRYEPQSEEIISAGIDIGTSTTKIVISRFSLMNMAGGTHMPRIEIIEKEVLHRSAIHRTPLLDETAIDIAAVEKIVNEEYKKAGIQPKDIKTGAVIITGETATKKNAEQMVHHLSDQAGEFLVAAAGPDLEGIIAAKGSGASEYSRRTGKVIANIDIGGGTANAAVFKSGRLCGTCTLHIGGRLIEFSDSKVKSISKPVKEFMSQKGLSIHDGDTRDLTKIRTLTEWMAETIAMMLECTLPAGHTLLLGHEANWQEDIDAIMFSGGISECIYRFEPDDTSGTDYNDIGMALAESLKESSRLSEWPWVEPMETVRATVLGAGTQTTEISGATISVDTEALPQRNLPVYQIDFQLELQTGLDRFAIEFEKAMEIYDPFLEGRNFALYLTGLPYLGFRDIQQLAAAILAAAKQKPVEQPVVVVLESDHAKALGQTLKHQANGKTILCIDQIKVEHGDYIDIGALLQTNVVPVVIKTLTFEH